MCSSLTVIFADADAAGACLAFYARAMTEAEAEMATVVVARSCFWLAGWRRVLCAVAGPR